MEPGTTQERFGLWINKSANADSTLGFSGRCVSHLHHGFVRVHELNGPVDSVYAALQVWLEEKLYKIY